MDEISILISAVGHATSPGLLNSLKNNGERKIKIIGVDMDPSVIVTNLVDEIHQVPPFSDPNYTDKILEICKKFSVDVYYARQEKEAIETSKRQNEFNDLNVKVIRPGPHQVLEISNNKGKFHEFFEKKRIPHANYKIIRKYSELEDALYDLGFPKKNVFLKPTESTGGRGAILVSKESLYNKEMREVDLTPYSLNSICDIFSQFKESEFPEIIAMEYLPGRYYSVDVLSKNGQTFYVVPKIRIKGNASNTIIGQVDLNSAVIDQAKKACKAFEFSFLQNYEMKMDENGKPIIYDINPRGGASLAFCTAAGVNLMYYAVKMALGENFPINKKIKDKLKMIRYYQEFYESN